MTASSDAGTVTTSGVLTGWDVDDAGLAFDATPLPTLEPLGLALGALLLALVGRASVRRPA